MVEGNSDSLRVRDGKDVDGSQRGASPVPHVPPLCDDPISAVRRNETTSPATPSSSCTRCTSSSSSSKPALHHGRRSGRFHLDNSDHSRHGGCAGNRDARGSQDDGRRFATRHVATDDDQRNECQWRHATDDERTSPSSSGAQRLMDHIVRIAPMSRCRRVIIITCGVSLHAESTGVHSAPVPNIVFSRVTASRTACWRSASVFGSLHVTPSVVQTWGENG